MEGKEKLKGGIDTSRWIEHLVLAGIAIVIFVVAIELLSGFSLSTAVANFFAQYGIGGYLLIAILILIGIAVWAKARSG